MGRGDKKTAKGKRFMGSFGVSRPHKTATTAPKAAAAPAAPVPGPPGKPPPSAPTSAPASLAQQQKQQEILKQFQQEAPVIPKEPPPEFEFIVDPPSISAMEL